MKNKPSRLSLTFLLLITVLLGSHFVLRPFSPRAVKSELYAIKFMEPTGYVKQYQLQGNRLDCSRDEAAMTRVCATMFEGKPLTVWTRNTPQQQLAPVDCELTYGGEAFACSGSWDYENRSPSVLVRDDLGISAETFQQLRRENPLLYLQESQWDQVVATISALCAMLIGLFAASGFTKEFVASWKDAPFVLGILSALSGGVGFAMLFQPQTRGYIVFGIALLIGLWGWNIARIQPLKTRRLDRFIFGTSIGLGAYWFIFLGLLFNLLALGFVD